MPIVGCGIVHKTSNNVPNIAMKKPFMICVVNVERASTSVVFDQDIPEDQMRYIVTTSIPLLSAWKEHASHNLRVAGLFFNTKVLLHHGMWSSVHDGVVPILAPTQRYYNFYLVPCRLPWGIVSMPMLSV